MLLYVIEYFLYGINPIIGVFNLKTNLFEIFQQLSSNYPFKVNKRIYLAVHRGKPTQK